MTKELTTREKIELFILIVVLFFLVMSGKVIDKHYNPSDEFGVEDEENN